MSKQEIMYSHVESWRQSGLTEGGHCEEQEEVIKQEITYPRSKEKHPGRASLHNHLRLEEIEIYPEGALSDKVCIDTATTDVLDYVLDYFKIKRYIRYKYATKYKENTQISIRLLPGRTIGK
ncbi:hypothetical protein ACYSNM_13020 [Myroides sp. LJL116]